jgi:galactose mutarotase-like enzyme
VLDRQSDGQTGKHFCKAAIVKDDKSGRKMELWTNKPGVQFYTSNMLNDTKGKGGYIYKKYAALCLETQGFPDSVNHPNFLPRLSIQVKPTNISLFIDSLLLRFLQSLI